MEKTDLFQGIEKLETGIEGFDLISYGGLPKGRTTLVAGTAGSAKTMFSVHFLAAGIFTYNQPGVFITFEEPPRDIRTNMSALGWNIEEWEKEGRLLVHCEYPEIASLEDHLIMVKDLIEDFKPKRVALDSLSALERISTVKGFREFIISLTSFIKHEEGEGMHIGKPFRNISGILSGNPQHIAQGEMDRLGSMFTE